MNESAVLTSNRRLGTPNSKTRSALVAAAIRVLKDHGYGALTSRLVAEKAGLKPQLVHYYFRTMDDLVLSLVHAGGEEGIRHTMEAAQSPDPLRAFWKTFIDPRSAALTTEVVSMAMHRESIRAEVVRYANWRRSIQVEALTQYYERHGMEPPVPPATIVLMMSAAARSLHNEAALGMTHGHAETKQEIERWLTSLSPPKRSRAKEG